LRWKSNEDKRAVDYMEIKRKIIRFDLLRRVIFFKEQFFIPIISIYSIKQFYNIKKLRKKN